MVEAWCAQGSEQAVKSGGRIRVLAVLFEASRQQDSKDLLARIGERLRRGSQGGGACSCAKTDNGDGETIAKRARLAGSGVEENLKTNGGNCSCSKSAASNHPVVIDMSTSVQSLSRRFEFCVWLCADDDGGADREAALRLVELQKQWQNVRPDCPDFMGKEVRQKKRK
jgi:hypothetical protein